MDVRHASAQVTAVFQKVSQIMIEQLEAEISIAAGKTDAALQLLARTTVEEDALTFEVGPPLILKPAHELYGEELVRAVRISTWTWTRT
jgi:hypothetical protein